MDFKREHLSCGSAYADPEDGQATNIGAANPFMMPMLMDSEIGTGNDNDGVVESVQWEQGQPPAADLREKWCAIAFFVQLLAVASVALVAGIVEPQQVDEADPKDDFTDNSNNRNNLNKNYNTASGAGSIPTKVLMLIGISALTAISLSTASLFLVHTYSNSCVKGAFMASTVIFALFGLISIGWVQLSVPDFENLNRSL